MTLGAHDLGDRVANALPLGGGALVGRRSIPIGEAECAAAEVAPFAGEAVQDAGQEGIEQPSACCAQSRMRGVRITPLLIGGTAESGEVMQAPAADAEPVPVPIPGGHGSPIGSGAAGGDGGANPLRRDAKGLGEPLERPNSGGLDVAPTQPKQGVGGHAGPQGERGDGLAVPQQQVIEGFASLGHDPSCSRVCEKILAPPVDRPMQVCESVRDKSAPTGDALADAPAGADQNPLEELAVSNATEQEQLFPANHLDAELRTAFRNPAMSWDPTLGPVATCKGIAWQWRDGDEENPLAVCVHDAKRFREHFGIPVTDERAADILAAEAGQGAFYDASTRAFRQWQDEVGEWDEARQQEADEDRARDAAEGREGGAS